MPSNKFKTRFPPARIKKIMQTDEEVGKVAAAVPVIVSKSVELFTEILLQKSGDIAIARGARTLSIDHIRQCVEEEHKFDFLRELVQEAAAKALGKTGEEIASVPVTPVADMASEPDIPQYDCRKSTLVGSSSSLEDGGVKSCHPISSICSSIDSIDADSTDVKPIPLIKKERKVEKYSSPEKKMTTSCLLERSCKRSSDEVGVSSRKKDLDRTGTKDAHGNLKWEIHAEKSSKTVSAAAHRLSCGSSYFGSHSPTSSSSVFEPSPFLFGGSPTNAMPPYLPTNFNSSVMSQHFSFNHFASDNNATERISHNASSMLMARRDGPPIYNSPADYPGASSVIVSNGQGGASRRRPQDDLSNVVSSRYGSPVRARYDNPKKGD